MTNQVFVSNLQELEQALANATGGGTIILRDGDYGDLNISNTQFSSEVTLRAENPQGAIFETITINNVSNLTIDGIELNFQNEENAPIFTRVTSIKDSDNIKLINSELHGSEDGNLDNDVYLLEVISSQNIEISNNEFHNAVRGGVVSDVDNIIISQNSLHTIRSDGFTINSVRNISISDNSFRDFFPNLEAGDHPDAIQLFTTGASRESGNIIINNNTFDQGVGDGFQSIFIEESNSDLGFFNVLVEGNVIRNDSAHGITVTQARDVLIQNNTVLASEGASIEPRINILDQRGNVVVQNNVAGGFTLPEDINSSNNIEVNYTNVSADNFVDRLFFDAVSGPYLDLEGIIPIRESLLDNSGSYIGAASFSDTSNDLVARFTIDNFVGTSDSLTVELDALFSTNEDGILSDAVSSFIFDFGDGTIAEGQAVRHTFDRAGTYDVTLTVEVDGQVDSFTRSITVSDPQLLNFENIVNDESLNQDLINSSDNMDILILDGSDPILISTQNAAFSQEELFVEVEFRPIEGGVSRQRIITDQGSYFIQLDGDTIRFSVITDDGENHQIIHRFENFYDGNFHRVSLSFDGSEGVLQAFVDGQLVGEVFDAFGIIMSGNDSSIAVGGDLFGSRNFSGEIRDVNVFSALQPTEVDFARTEILSGPNVGQIIEHNDGVSVDNDPVSLPSTSEQPEPVEQPDTDPVSETDPGPAPVPDETEPVSEEVGSDTEPAQDDTPVAPEPVVEPIAISDNAIYQLRSGSDVNLTGGATETNGTFSFDGSGLANLGRPDAFDSKEEVTVAFDLRTDGANGNGAQRLLSDHARFGVELKGDTLNFRLFTDEGEFINIQVEDAGVTDGEYHNVAFTFDAAAGSFSAFIDGVEVGRETGISGNLNAPSNRDVTLGGSTSGRDFDGDIRDLRVFDDAEAAADEVGLATIALDGSTSSVTGTNPSSRSFTDDGQSAINGDSDDDWALSLTGNDF